MTQTTSIRQVLDSVSRSLTVSTQSEYQELVAQALRDLDRMDTPDTRGKTLDEVHLILDERIAKLQHLAEKDDSKNKGKFSELAFTIEELEEVQAEIRSMQANLQMANPNEIYQSTRGDGTTTKQIKASPEKAIFVCPNMTCVEYSKRLAANLGRQDIKFVSPSFFEHHRWRGILKSKVVIDHAARSNMTPTQKKEMDIAMMVMHD